MTKSMRAFGSIAVALALAVPVTAWAQAGPRNGGSTSTGIVEWLVERLVRRFVGLFGWQLRGRQR